MQDQEAVKLNPIILASYGDAISNRLRAQGLMHWDVAKRGQHRVVSPRSNPMVPRPIKSASVGAMDRPFPSGSPVGTAAGVHWKNGSVQDLVTTLLSQFGFMLSDW